MSKLKIENIMHIEDLETLPEFQGDLFLDDKMTQSLALLCGKSKTGRRLIRVGEQGQLIIGEVWQLYSKNTFVSTTTVQNEFNSIALNGTHDIISLWSMSFPSQARIYRVSGGDYYDMILPPDTLITICHKCGDIKLNTFPNATGTATPVVSLEWTN